jgi:trimethylamine--corrinoid protein Co-methyltransferase
MENTISIRPGIQVLSPEAISVVHAASLNLLSTVGIRVDSLAAIKVFSSSKQVRFLDESHVAFQPEVVEWAIQQCPPRLDIYDRNGQKTIRLGEDSARFGIGVTNLFYHDPSSDEILLFTRDHMRQSVGLGNSLPSYDLISTIGVIRDVDPRIADLAAMLEMVANTTKPLIILISDQAQFLPGLVMLERLVGSLSDKPFVIPYFNPVTPLILNQSTAENMLTTIEHGMPLIFSNYGMAGMSTPITSAGILALLNAELLAGLVFSQLVKPGTPVILGSLPAFFDMKAMVDFFDPQTMLLNLACAEMMAYYQIPHAGTSGSANGWGADLVASQALMINHLTSLMGKVGLVPFVGGTHGSKVFSPLMTVYSNEIIEQARQFTKGFIINEETLALSEVQKAGTGGSFLSSHQTLKLFREAYHSSSIFPRLSLEKWQEAGMPADFSYLREHTLDLLNHPVYPPDQQELLQKGSHVLRHPESLF